MTAALILFDDAIAAEWKPFAWTRPVGELVFGACSFRERAERLTGLTCNGSIAPHLAGFDEPDAAPVVESDSIDTSVARLYLDSRFVPAWNARFEAPDGTAVLVADGRAIGWFSPAGSVGPDRAFLDRPSLPLEDVPHIEFAGRSLTDFWQLITQHGEQLTEDMRHLVDGAGEGLPGGLTPVAGSPANIRVGRRVQIEPGVAIDCSAGAIWIEDDVRVRAFTRIAGPARIGAHSTLLGGSFDGVTIGSHCKVRGEIEASVVLGCSNKAHDGFIGHAFIGRWVNLGAFTTNSDLKNNYGNVRVTTPAGEVDTDAIKVGCFIGDHVKTAIGTLLNTGTVIGPGSVLFGERMPPKYVPPFSWGNGDTTHELDRFMKTAATVMARRNVALTAGVQAVLERAWTAGRRDGW